jgi:hypothetical protein
MNEEQKAKVYGSLLNEHTRYFNEINRIKGDNLELNREQRLKIQELENKQKEIMEKTKKLFS